MKEFSQVSVLCFFSESLVSLHISLITGAAITLIENTEGDLRIGVPRAFNVEEMQSLIAMGYLWPWDEHKP